MSKNFHSAPITIAEAAYRSLVDTANVLEMISGDTNYATFIDHVDVIIEH